MVAYPPHAVSSRTAPQFAPTSEQQHAYPVPPICTRCHGSGEIRRKPCMACGAIGEIMTPAQMAHHMLSAPFGEPGMTGYTLPMANDTTNPSWLADLIACATDETGHALSCEQLLNCADNIQHWKTTYFPKAPWWRPATLRIVKIIATQLLGSLA